MKKKPSIRHFTLSFEEWQKFYHHKTSQVDSNWSNQLSSYITRANITCCITFKKHFTKKKESRKKNCNLFSCQGQCGFRSCTIRITIIVESEPKKGSPVVFTIYMFGEMDHSKQDQPVARPLTGSDRVTMDLINLSITIKFYV